jgi:hypothetical protein
MKVSEEKPAKKWNGLYGEGFKMVSEDQHALHVISTSGNERLIENLNQPSWLGVKIGAERTEKWFDRGLHAGFIPVKRHPKIELHRGA